MADVYVLASPSPTLYVYPSTVHPTTGGPPLAPVFTPARAPRRLRDSGSHRYRLAVLGRAQIRADGVTQHVTVAASGAGRSRAAGAVGLSTSRSVQIRGTRGAARAVANVAALVRCADHTHLALPLPLFDLLTESWDS